MRIKMLMNKHGAPDGHTVKLYTNGEEYDLPEGLAKIFLAEKAAEVVLEAKAEAPLKNKAEKVAKNKDVK